MSYSKKKFFYLKSQTNLKSFKFQKTRNTFKGQLGFNTNHPPTTTPNKQTTQSKVPLNKNSFNQENSVDLENNSEFLEQSPLIERTMSHRKHR